MTSVPDSPQYGLRKLVLALAITGFSAVALSACNTVDGAGKDIESTGEAIQDGVDD